MIILEKVSSDPKHSANDITEQLGVFEDTDLVRLHVCQLGKCLVPLCLYTM